MSDRNTSDVDHLQSEKSTVNKDDDDETTTTTMMMMIAITIMMTAVVASVVVDAAGVAANCFTMTNWIYGKRGPTMQLRAISITSLESFNYSYIQKWTATHIDCARIVSTVAIQTRGRRLTQIVPG